MAKKTYSVRLTREELDVTLNALTSALAGDWEEGDFCWTEEEAGAADSAASKIGAALSKVETGKLK
jgi:hypothetical protein